jgi:hypothetical protein
MRVINKSQKLECIEKMATSASPPIDLTDKQPCWYVEIEKREAREKAKWKVGVKHASKTDEYSFKISKAGDIKDDKFWARATSKEFAIKLLELYKTGGRKAVRDWVNSGC